MKLNNQKAGHIVSSKIFFYYIHLLGGSMLIMLCRPIEYSYKIAVREIKTTGVRRFKSVLYVCLGTKLGAYHFWFVLF